MATIVSITWVGHATMLIEMDGIRILTDPLLGHHAGLLRRPTMVPDVAVSKDIDAVLISHLHLDHAEVGSLRRVSAPVVYSGRANARWLRDRAKVAGCGLELFRPQRIPSRGQPSPVEVQLVRAVHHSRPMPHRPNDAYGFLLSGPSAVVWFAGDTSLYDGLADLPELAGGSVDVALLPIGGWGPRLSGGHMGPVQAAQACALVQPKAVVPMHFGTLHAFGMHVFNLGWMVTPLYLFSEQLKRVAPSTTLLATPPGGRVVWPPPASH